jgi:glycosyltransferase involved in cell wall biosynthesis
VSTAPQNPDLAPYISLIFPAYNEAQRIAGTVREAISYFETRGYRYEIIVAADGNDGTREIVTVITSGNPAVKVIGSPDRGGKGLGIRKAVFMARGQIIGFSDADNKTPISEFDKLDAALRQGADLAIGSRALPETVIERRQPLIRRLGSKAFAVIMQSLVGLRGIVDSQCGFKFFRADVARYLFGRQRIDGYMFDVEILVIALRANFKIAQVPVRWRDDNDSRFHIISGGLRDMRELLAIRWMALRGLYDRSRETTLRTPAETTTRLALSDQPAATHSSIL